MKFPCGKRFVSFTWCVFECLFLTGILNGWSWMQQILTEDGYYIEACNVSIPVSSVSADSSMFGLLNMDEELHNPILLNHEGLKVKCVYKKVFKVVSLDEYARLEKDNMISPEHYDVIDDVNNNVDCSEQADRLEFVFALVLIFKNILMFPLGILLDTNGTSQVRIIAM